jgi:hypothetical protein
VWAKCGHDRHLVQKQDLPAHMSIDDRSLLSGLNCSDGPAGEGENRVEQGNFITGDYWRWL